MASKEKEEIPMATMSPRSKHAFFEDCLQKHKDLSKSQREYKNVLSMRMKKRSEHIVEKSYEKAIGRLQNERNDLRAQIWVANARSHVTADQKYLEQIQCHVKCQERLSEQIGNCKKLIVNLQREKGRVDKQIYELNRKTVADSQHQEYVAQVRKKIVILENRVEVGVRHECTAGTANEALRNEINMLLSHREHFNDAYTKYIQKLHDDKKYLMDLLDYATHSYERLTEMSEKIFNSTQKSNKESEQTKLKLQNIMRDSAAAELINGFMACKNQQRPIADLAPIEIRRRAAFKHNHLKKIKVYNTVLSNLYDFTQSHNVSSVVDNFQQQETLYHSYFTFANRTSFHLTSLETSLDRLYIDLIELKKKNRNNFSQQHEVLFELHAKLEEQKKHNAKLDAKILENKKHLEIICLQIASIFNLCLADATPLIAMLGNHSYIDLHNLGGFLKILESRILDIVRNVYFRERDEAAKGKKYIIREVVKYCDEPTSLDDIVLTQQCPECAEGEIFNTADGAFDGVEIMTVANVKKKLIEEVNQPDMQYRLHSVSQCRLPKSRLLAAKRHA